MSLPYEKIKHRKLELLFSPAERLSLRSIAEAQIRGFTQALWSLRNTRRMKNKGVMWRFSITNNRLQE
jgi:hypothetical protein